MYHYEDFTYKQLLGYDRKNLSFLLYSIFILFHFYDFAEQSS